MAKIKVIKKMKKCRSVYERLARRIKRDKIRFKFAAT